MTVRGTFSKAVAGVALAGVVALGAGGAAFAKGGNTQVGGMLYPDQDASCSDDPGAVAAYDVDGGLNGCWYIDTYVVENETPSGSQVASGTEQFVGCMGSTCGTFYTTYKFTSKWVNGVEVHGRCTHPITGGKDGFAGASGTIQMHDLENGCATYSGHISL